MLKISKLKISLIVTVIIILLFVGCTSNITNDPTKIIGKWKTENAVEGDETLVTFEFFDNGSYLITATIPNVNDTITTTNIWNNYTIDDEMLILKIMDEDERLFYSFSDNYNTLTLTEEDSSTETVLFRIR